MPLDVNVTVNIPAAEKVIDFVTIPADNYSVYNSLGILMGTYNSPHLQTTNFPNGVYFVRIGDSVLNFVK